MKDAPGYSSAWLPYLPMDIPAGSTPAQIARIEMAGGLAGLGLAYPFEILPEGKGEAYHLGMDAGVITIRGGEPGVLYGVYEALSLLARGQAIQSGRRSPFYPLRMLNHWDNPDGSVERGYGGRSLFFDRGQISHDPVRIHRYARMLASVGINGVCLNNVNVIPPADALLDEDTLPRLAGLADILRRYGIRLVIAVDFSMPARFGPGTADPLDESVQAWWARRAELAYALIPDLLGFLVKADSENRPGPETYGRNHADGANMLARGLKPHGGRVFWRCFVYNCRQDWRDAGADRPKAAYDCFMPLDGCFDDNVILQIKNGPYDFQVREPASTLLFSLRRTNKALEVQLAQEYTGQQIDLFYMAPGWRDLFEALPPGNADMICAVSNLGDDANWTGHDLALANLYAFGRMAWAGRSDPEALALEWAQLTFPDAATEISRILLSSADVYERYTSPLGLGWMVNVNTHYGPSPEGYEFSRWGTYHKANHDAIGIDRSTCGTGFSRQYPPALAAVYDDPDLCPEKLLLFFHRMRYDHIMPDGRTLLQRIYDDHFDGARDARKLRDAWLSLAGKVPEDVFDRVRGRFDLQVHNANEWRDVINTWFFRKTGIPDAQGRKIYP